MKEYIEREALNELIDREISVCNSGMIRGELEYLKAIVPIAADVVERKRGEWIDTRKLYGDYMCSNCEALYGTNKFNFCPNCGADMRKTEANHAD